MLLGSSVPEKMRLEIEMGKQSSPGCAIVVTGKSVKGELALH
jgi:hypothetical protein